MLVIEIIGVFLFGIFMGSTVMYDEMSYKLDKCDSVRQDLHIAIDECNSDLKLCEIRQCKEADNE